MDHHAEGSGKGLLAILAAILLVVVIAHWDRTLYLLGVLWDLAEINIRPILFHIGEFFSKHRPF